MSSVSMQKFDLEALHWRSSTDRQSTSLRLFLAFLRDIFTLNEHIIIATLLKFIGYIHNHKILHGDIFGLILKNKMAATGVFSTFSKDFCWPSRAKGIVGRDLKFAVYVPHYTILTGNIFGLILKKQDGRHRHFFVSHEKCLYLPYYWS